MRRRRNAIIGALVWWFGTRYAKKRATRALSAVPGIGGSDATASRGTLGVGGALALVGVVVGALVAWRKLRGPGEPDELPAAPSPPTEKPAAADNGA